MAELPDRALAQDWRDALSGKLKENETVRVFLDLATAGFSDGRYTQALFFFEKSRKIKALETAAQNKLGQCWLYLGAPGEALKILKPLGKTAAAPLARAFRETGNLKEAEGLMNQNATEPGELLELGLVLDAAGRGGEALALFDTVKFDHPGFADELFECADGFLACNYFGEAGRTLKTLEKIARADADFLFEIGLRYFQMNMAGEAEAILRRAIACRPLPKIYRELAAFYERSNQIEKAMSFIANARAGIPGDPTFALTFAKVLARQGKAGEALEVLEPINLEGLSGHISGEIWSLKAKTLDKLGRFDEAFEGFAKSKAALAETPEYKALKLDIPYANAKAFVNINLAALPREKPAPDEVKRPQQLVFFMGFPRSGTTLIQTILDSHPNIRSVDEKAVMAPGINLLKALPKGYPKEVLNLNAAEIHDLRALYFLEARNYGDFEASDTLVDKLPLLTLHLPLIKTVFPDCKILFALRNPLASAWSCFVQHFAMNNSMGNLYSMAEIARFYDMTMSFWRKCTNEMGFDYHLIRYETLIEDPEGEARAVCAYLGLEFNKDMLNFTARARDKGLISTPSYSQVVKPIYREARDHWKNYQKHFSPVEKTMKTWCRHFGYPVD